MDDQSSDYGTNIDQTLKPLLESSADWFQDPPVQYETALGPHGSVSKLSPQAVVFQFTALVNQHPQISELEVGKRVSEHKETVFVGTSRDNELQSKPTAWISSDGYHFHYQERVPFTNSVSTLEGVRNELSEIMDLQPDWDELFDMVREEAVIYGESEAIRSE